jgi:hypothetical protein
MSTTSFHDNLEGTHSVNLRSRWGDIFSFPSILKIYEGIY